LHSVPDYAQIYNSIVKIRRTHWQQLATARHVILGLVAILGHNAPVRSELDAAPIGQVSRARTSLAASGASDADMALHLRNAIREGRS
jgi:hypothetical protein